jgi:hypothetical protein
MGLKSGNLLKEFKGHKAVVNDMAVIGKKANQLITASDDGEVIY